VIVSVINCVIVMVNWMIVVVIWVIVGHIGIISLLVVGTVELRWDMMTLSFSFVIVGEALIIGGLIEVLVPIFIGTGWKVCSCPRSPMQGQIVATSPARMASSELIRTIGLSRFTKSSTLMSVVRVGLAWFFWLASYESQSLSSGHNLPSFGGGINSRLVLRLIVDQWVVMNGVSFIGRLD